MKRLLVNAATVVVAVGAVVGGANAVDNHYQTHKQQKQVQQANQVETAKAAQYSTDKAQLDLVVKQNVTLLAECQKGLTAYAKLPAALKVQTPLPQCTAPTAK